MRLFIAADHAGYALKESLKPYLASLGHQVEDCGAFALDPSDDYPDFVSECAEQVAAAPGSMGIIIGASGQGEAMVANRTKGVRAAVYYGAPARSQTDTDGNELGMLESVRSHNDANVLSLGARFLSEQEAQEAVRTFIEASFEGGERHLRRIAKF